MIDCTQNSLYHHGIQGQRWGVRRFQNSDGSLTDAGKKRYLKNIKKQEVLPDKAKTLKRIGLAGKSLAIAGTLAAVDAATGDPFFMISALFNNFGNGYLTTVASIVASSVVAQGEAYTTAVLASGAGGVAASKIGKSMDRSAKKAGRWNKARDDYKRLVND